MRYLIFGDSNVPDFARICDYEKCERSAICVCDKCHKNICFIHLDARSQYFECICRNCMNTIFKKEKERER